MAKGSSGFDSGGNKAKSVIGNEKPITVDVMYRSGYHGEVFRAKQDGDSIVMNYNENTEWEKESRSTSIVHHTLDAGIYSTSKNQNRYGAYSSYNSHNINWENVREVSGQTYHLNEFLKEKGYKWNKEKKAWVR